MNKQEAKQYTDSKIGEIRSLFDQKYDINILQPIMEEQILDLEMSYNISIKEDYKEWLRFSAKMSAVNNEVSLYLPDMTINRVFSLPVGYFVIGEIRPLNVVFAVRTNGTYYYFVQGKNTQLDSFGDILDMICRYIRKEPIDLNVPEVPAKPEKTEGSAENPSSGETLLTYFYIPKSVGVYTEQIFHIKNNCAILQNECESVFGEPMDLKEIDETEKRLGIKFSVAYKVWLQNCGSVSIYGSTLRLFRPDESDFYKKEVPEDLITIGTLIGDGEYLCISRKTGKFVRYYNGVYRELYDFGCVLTWIDSFLKDHLPYSSDVRPKYIENDDQIPSMSPRELYVYMTRIKPDKYYDAALFWKNRISKYPEKREQFVKYLKNSQVENPEDSMSATLYDVIMLMLRSEAVREFWNNERELVKSGRGTENWNADQQISIMNIISMEDKLIRSNAGQPFLFDENKAHIKNGSDVDLVYEVRTINSVDDHSEYAGYGKNLSVYCFPYEK